MPRSAAKQLHYEKMLANKYKAKTHHPAFAAAPELSGEIGKSSDCRQANMLQTITRPTPARPTPYDCINKLAAATQQSNSKLMVKMPLDVLAST